jgi:CRISPR/Cas system-associated exonuclease Cas4 (RecB family)
MFRLGNLSWSALTLYQNCPYAFKLAYIDKLIPIRTRAYSRGNYLHYAFYYFFDNFYIKDGVVYPKFKVRDEFSSEFNFFLKFENKRYKKLCSEGKEAYFKPVLREEDIANNKLAIHGIIDRIDRVGDGEFEIVDYKTNSSSYVESTIRQLAFYNLVLEEHFNVVSWRVFNPVRGENFRCEKNKEVMDFVRNQVDMVRKEIQKEAFDFAKKISSCYYCGFKVFCEKWKR